ncbi:hypothetical protein LWI29_026767 [Acer saccharum]|uniref:Uncharacterized protein n=1 Tax=Acer saccharum TaxID=4024 RepID=A0AA39SLV4_ACESA|nr:hypothetical protein LWI29_026767 [Acer saccharum]
MDEIDLLCCFLEEMEEMNMEICSERVRVNIITDLLPPASVRYVYLGIILGKILTSHDLQNNTEVQHIISQCHSAEGEGGGDSGTVEGVKGEGVKSEGGRDGGSIHSRSAFKRLCGGGGGGGLIRSMMNKMKFWKILRRTSMVCDDNKHRAGFSTIRRNVSFCFFISDIAARPIESEISVLLYGGGE